MAAAWLIVIIVPLSWCCCSSRFSELQNCPSRIYCCSLCVIVNNILLAPTHPNEIKEGFLRRRKLILLAFSLVFGGVVFVCLFVLLVSSLTNYYCAAVLVFFLMCIVDPFFCSSSRLATQERMKEGDFFFTPWNSNPFQTLMCFCLHHYSFSSYLVVLLASSSFFQELFCLVGPLYFL